MDGATFALASATGYGFYAYAKFQVDTNSDPDTWMGELRGEVQNVFNNKNLVIGTSTLKTPSILASVGLPECSTGTIAHNTELCAVESTYHNIVYQYEESTIHCEMKKTNISGAEPIEVFFTKRDYKATGYDAWEYVTSDNKYYEFSKTPTFDKELSDDYNTENNANLLIYTTTLKMKNLSSTVHDGIYACGFNDNYGYDPIRISVVGVKLNTPKAYAAGSAVTLQCEADSPEAFTRNPTVKWFRMSNNTEITDGVESGIDSGHCMAIAPV
eukprot:sb/3468150/